MIWWYWIRYSYSHFPLIIFLFLLNGLLQNNHVLSHNEVQLKEELDQRIKANKVKKEESDKLREIKATVFGGCGFIKTCLKICALEEAGCNTCIKDHTCRAIVTLEHKKDEFHFKLLKKLQSHNKEFIAIGVSKDQVMGSDPMIACVIDAKIPDNNNFTKKDLITNHFAVFALDANKNLEYTNADDSNGIPQDFYSVPNHEVVDGNYFCEFKLKSQFTMKNVRVNLDVDDDSQGHFLLAAVGEASDMFTLAGHQKSEGGRTSSSKRFSFKNVDETSEDYDEDYDSGGNGLLPLLMISWSTSCTLISILSCILVIFLN